jgi:hypothetical protein
MEIYHDNPAYGSSVLSAFATDKSKTFAKVKPSLSMQWGMAWESIVYDIAEGESTFGEKFYITKRKVQPKLAEAFNSKEPEKFKRINKDKSTTKGYDDFNYLIDEMVELKKFPIQDITHTLMANVMVNRLMNMPIDLFLPFTFKDLLEFEHVWQTPIFWNDCGMDMKGLYDVSFSVPNINGDVRQIPVDLKLMETWDNFKRFYATKYWIQEQHYISGGKHQYGNIYPNLVFVIGTHSGELYNYIAPDESQEYNLEAYRSLLLDFAKFKSNGFKHKGYHSTKRNLIWIKYG